MEVQEAIKTVVTRNEEDVGFGGENVQHLENVEKVENMENVEKVENVEKMVALCVVMLYMLIFQLLLKKFDQWRNGKMGWVLRWV